MAYDDQREIFERLAALERMMGSRSGEHGHRGRGGHGRHHDRHRHHDHHHHHGDDDGFDEKRVIDTIVALVGERVERALEEHRAHDNGAADGGGEKRIVDLVVGLVAEHVREIVATELDRRFGKGPLPAPAPDAEPR